MKVTIITPCLNSAGTIRKTIESVMHQTYKNIEYIIVDGGSTDGTLEIISEYISRFSGRLRYVSERDHGVYEAMNKGIRMSHGNLIGIINSDDFYEEDAVESILAHMGAERYQVIYGYCRMIKNGHTRDLFKRHHKNLLNAMIPHPTCFLTRDIYREFGLFLECFKIASDYELMLRLFLSNRVKFTQVEKVIANFELGGLSSCAERLERERALILYRYKIISLKELISRLLG